MFFVRPFLFFWVMAAGLVLSGGQGLASSSGIPWDVEEHVLSNGLKILFFVEDRAPVLTSMIWYRVGSRNELPGFTGMAHMVEHMMFKGTNRFGPKIFSNRIQRNGGRHNAFTSHDYTAYFERMASDRVGVAFELEADRMRHILLDPREFLLERDVVREERRRSIEDNPIRLLWENLRAAAFKAHPYGWPIIGWASDIEQLDVETARQFYQSYYSPNNAVLVVVGSFDPPSLLKQIRREFDYIPRGSESPSLQAKEPSQRGERRIFVKKEAQLPYVGVAYHVPNVGSPDAYALEVLAEVLGGGRSGRLRQELVEKRQLALSADAGYSLISADPELFTLSAQPTQGVSAEVSEKALYEVLERIKTEGIGEEELKRVKRRISAQHVMQLDSQFFRALLLGRAETIGSWRLVTEFLPNIRKVTSEDIQRVAQTYLTEENRTVGFLVPLPITTSRQESPPSPSPHGRGETR